MISLSKYIIVLRLIWYLNATTLPKLSEFICELIHSVLMLFLFFHLIILKIFFSHFLFTWNFLSSMFVVVFFSISSLRFKSSALSTVDPLLCNKNSVSSSFNFLEKLYSQSIQSLLILRHVLLAKVFGLWSSLRDSTFEGCRLP